MFQNFFLTNVMHWIWRVDGRLCQAQRYLILIDDGLIIAILAVLLLLFCLVVVMLVPVSLLHDFRQFRDSRHRRSKNPTDTHRC